RERRCLPFGSGRQRWRGRGKGPGGNGSRSLYPRRVQEFADLGKATSDNLTVRRRVSKRAQREPRSDPPVEPFCLRLRDSDGSRANIIVARMVRIVFGKITIDIYGLVRFSPRVKGSAPYKARNAATAMTITK